jgi:hypothetical protein
MTDLLTKVKAALETHEASWDENGKYLAGTETTALEDMAPDMARALIAAVELADATEALRPFIGYGMPIADKKARAAEALDAFRAAMEGRTDG